MYPVRLNNLEDFSRAKDPYTRNVFEFVVTDLSSVGSGLVSIFGHWINL
jgi:hypothetical protein